MPCCPAKLKAQGKVKLFQNTVHFPLCKKKNPTMTSEYPSEFTKLLQAFCQRFWNIESKQRKLNIFIKSFNVKAEDKLQHVNKL